MALFIFLIYVISGVKTVLYYLLHQINIKFTISGIKANCNRDREELLAQDQFYCSFIVLDLYHEF